ncbi:albusnodin/ikarugamycin family macrolactam cyclase [Streptomyces netropsis]|uniref:albusnodin/ikarugamycin family macrolactam cyclase n=1 Tax=Streptomyces netropsis TaxID=55404 RepID=UPI0037B45753
MAAPRAGAATSCPATWRGEHVHWFGGGSSGAPVPEGAHLIWSDPPLWVVGPWPERRVKTVHHNGVQLAVLGPCSVGAAELERAMSARDLAGTAGLWAGSYTVVRHRRGRDEVDVLADPVGGCPLYTVSTAHGTVWGSSSRALAGLVGQQVDAEWLGAFLADKQSPLPGHSSWAGVAPVPAGHLMVLGRDGAASVTPWWAPARRSYGVAVPLVAELLADGVQARVEGVSASSDLAGTDSTTVAVLAAQHGRVLALTAHPEGVTWGGDMKYARQLRHPSIEHLHFPLGRAHLPFAPTATPLPATDEPAPSSGLWAMLSEQLLSVAAHGATCHLTGDGGDNLFMAPPTHLADLARHGRMLRLGHDAMAWAQLRRTSPWPLLRSALRRDTRGLARPWLERPAWLLAPAAGTPLPPDGADSALVADVRGAAHATHQDVQLAAALGVELNNPYFDGALLDAVVSVPAPERFTVRRYKPLLVDAIGPLLPEAHRLRATKGVFAGDFHRGARESLPLLLALTDGRLAEMGLIDPGPLRAAIHRLALGAESVWPPILAVLTAEMWLGAATTTAPTTWVPVGEVPQ